MSNLNENIKIKVGEAIEVIRGGGIIAFPTDTVYGLGADPWNEAAVERLYRIKDRPYGKALPLLISENEAITQLAALIPEIVWELVNKYWPGPLTIVLYRSKGVPAYLTGGGETVALRCPDHPLALELINRLGAPLAVTSANISGENPFYDFDGVRASFADKVDLILPGEVKYGIVSTVIDFTGAVPQIVRSGALKIEV